MGRKYHEPLKRLNKLMSEGQESEAKAMLRGLELRRYKDPNALNQLGLFAQRLELHDVAKRIFQHGMSIIGKNAILLNNLGLSLLRLGEPIEAERRLRQAVAIEPTYDRALINLGSVLIQLLRPDDACAIFEVLRKLQPDRPEAFLGLALAHQSLGRTQEAASYAAQALEIHSTSLEGLQILVECLRAERRYSEAYRVVERALSLYPEAAGFFFEFGHLHHQSGRYEDALRAFDRAHQLFPPMDDEKRAFLKDRYLLESMYERLSEQSFGAIPDVDPTQPIFIVGSPRSGTTLLERMLNMHPEVHSLGETHLVGRVASEALEKLHSGSSFADLVERLWRGQEPKLLEFCRSRFRSRLAELRPAAADGQRLIDKMPSNAWRLGFIAIVAPGAPIIQMIRDGRDVAMSAYSQNFSYPPWHAQNLEDALLEWGATLALCREAKAACPMPHTTLCYENLVSSPEAELRSILSFLGLSYQENCLRFHEREGPVHTASRFQVRRPLNHESVGRAAHYPKVFEHLSAMAQEELKRYGYKIVESKLNLPSPLFDARA